VKQFLDGPLDLVDPDRTLLASLDKACLKLVSFEGLMPPITFDRAQLDTFDHFVSGIPGLAT
jgi:hypothetical protein